MTARTAEGEASHVDGHLDAATEARPAEGGLTPRVLLRESAPIWVVLFAVYTLTLSSVPALTHDSLTYLNAMHRGGVGLWHPHHLVYNAIGAEWLRFVRSLGVVSDGLKIVAWVNSALGATSAVLCYLLLRDRAQTGRLLALAGTVGAVGSFGFWFYSVSVEVYLLPLTVLLAATYVLISPRLGIRHVLAVGGLTGLAVLGHQVNVMFGAVVVVVLLGKARTVGRATVARWFAAWAATASAVVVAAYGLVMWLVVKPQSAAEANSWFTRYAGTDTFWVPPGPSTLPRAGFGASRAIVGGHFMFRFGWFRDRVASAMPGKSLIDEAFLVRNLPIGLAALLAVTALVGGILLVLVLVRGVRRRGFVPARARTLLLALAAWVVTYSLFFLVWEPTNVEFWIPQITCVWLAAAALCARSARAADPDGDADAGGPRRAEPGLWPRLLLAAAVLVSVTNFAGSILPAVDSANDIYAYRFRALGRVVGVGDAVVVDRPYLSTGYNTRNTGAGAIPAEPHSETVGPIDPADSFTPEAVVLQVQTVLDGGHRVAVEPELVDNPASDEAEQVGDLLDRIYGDRWYRVEPAPGVEWLVIDPPAFVP